MNAVERAAEVLAEHHWQAEINDMVDPYLWCTCGWRSDDATTDHWASGTHARLAHAHVAEALAAAGCLRDDREGETVTHTHTHQPSSIPGGCSCGWNHPGTPDGGDPS